MMEIQNSKRYDLEERTLNFTKRVIEFINKLPKILTNLEISKQFGEVCWLDCGQLY
jgi:hypothetical protein